MTTHRLEKLHETPRYTQYRCKVCCRPFRISRGTNPPVPEDCEGVPYKPQPLPDMPAAQPGASPEPVDARTPPVQVATTVEQRRRMAICNPCPKLNECLPTPCAKRVAFETGTCPDNKWAAPDYAQAVHDAVDHAEFHARFPGFQRMAKHTRISTLGYLAGTRPLRLYAIIATWHEADIVEAAVRNCFAEGCDRVYVLDNDSPDDTARQAVAAGAILAKVYRTAAYQDVYRVQLMNEIMQEITEAERLPELWWMALDCDEMPRGPGRYSVRRLLELQPDEVNSIGAIAFDHYPTEPLANVPGKHPADYQPFGWLRHSINGAFCNFRHWKHPVHKYIDGKFDAIQTRGLHDAWALPERGLTIEARDSIILHHFMFRNEAETRLRLSRLCGGEEARRSKPDDEAIGGEGAIQRYRMLDAIYARDWANVRMPHLQAFADLQRGGAPIDHWTHWLTAYDYEPRRWY